MVCGDDWWAIRADSTNCTGSQHLQQPEKISIPYLQELMQGTVSLIAKGKGKAEVDYMISKVVKTLPTEEMQPSHEVQVVGSLYTVLVQLPGLEGGSHEIDIDFDRCCLTLEAPTHAGSFKLELSLPGLPEEDSTSARFDRATEQLELSFQLATAPVPTIQALFDKPQLPTTLQPDGDSGGRAVVAKRALAPGELALAAEAYAVVVSDSSVTSHCHHCFERIERKALLCGGCRFARFCGTECMEAEDLTHHLECSALGRLGAAEEATRLLLAILCRAVEEEQQCEREPPSSLYSLALADVIELLSHREAAGDETVEMVEKMVDAVADARGASHPLAAEVLYRILCNAHPVHDQMGKQIALGLYPAGCYLNHSCMPNAVCSHLGHGRALVVRPLHPIAVGEQAADMEVQMEKELQQSLNLTQLTHLIEEASSMVYAARLAAINAAREVANWSVMAEQAKAAIEARETWLAGDLLGLVTLHLLYGNALKADGREKSVVKAVFERHYKLCVICFGEDHLRTNNAKLVMNARN